jgi:molybdopterin converting factor small subunit
VSVTVRYWAAARAAAGRAEESYDGVDTLADLLAAVRGRHAEGELPRVLLRCSYLVDEVSPGTRPSEQVEVRDGSVVEVLPPFAGGSDAPGGGGPGTPVRCGDVRSS